MKGKNIPGFYSFQQIWSSSALIFLAALFVCGVVAGCFTGLMAADSGQQVIRGLADAMTEKAVIVPGAKEALFAALGALGWQGAVLLVGWTRPASLFLSLICAARGFTFSFSVSALLQVFGAQGIWRSLAASGAAGVVTVPCLLLTAAACFLASQDAPRGGAGGYFYALSKYRGAIILCTFAAIWANALQLPIGWAIVRWILN